MRVIDAPIIDYVFQPIVNRLAGYTNQFNIGCFLLDGSAVGAIAYAALRYLTLDRDLLISVIVAISGITTTMMYRGVIADITRRIPAGRNAVNPARYSLLAGRLLTTLSLMICFWPPTSFLIAWQGLVWLALYFISCQSPTPRESRKPAIQGVG